MTPKMQCMSILQENATDGEYDAAAAKFERRLRDATDRVFELEESIVGKQTALERLVEENDSLRRQLDKDQVSGVIGINSKQYFPSSVRSKLLVT